MRYLAGTLLLAALIAAPAARADVIQVTIPNFAMPPPPGMPAGAQCRPYLGTTALAAARACGTAAALTFSVPAAGPYAIFWETVSAQGTPSALMPNGQRSPPMSFTASTAPPVPPTPTLPATGSGTCTNTTNPTFTCALTITVGP